MGLKAPTADRPGSLVAAASSHTKRQIEGKTAEGEIGEGMDKAAGSPVIEAMSSMPKGQDSPERERTAAAEDPATVTG